MHYDCFAVFVYIYMSWYPYPYRRFINPSEVCPLRPSGRGRASRVEKTSRSIA